jgi:hypothetical protein
MNDTTQCSHFTKYQFVTGPFEEEAQAYINGAPASVMSAEDTVKDAEARPGLVAHSAPVLKLIILTFL